MTQAVGLTVSNQSTAIIRWWSRPLPAVLPIIYVALALLSINCSEASVERSFSTQSYTHSLNRNRLLDANIENEMFVKLNRRALNDTDIRRPLVHLSNDAGTHSHSTYSDTSVAEHSDSDVESEDDDNHYNVNGSDNDTEMLSSDEDAADSDDEPVEQRVHDSANDANDIDDEPEPDSELHSRLSTDSASSTSSSVSVHPVKHAWSYHDTITPGITQWCDIIITQHSLVETNPWPRTFANDLETAMRSSTVMRKEQFTQVRSHIKGMVQQKREDRAAAAAAIPAVDATAMLASHGRSPSQSAGCGRA